MFRTGMQLAVVVSVLSVLLSAVDVALAQPGDKEPASKRVRLVIDYGDGVQKHFTQLAWSDQMTVLDALTAASRHPRGIKFKTRGKAATTFVTKIDDLENEGRQRNWVYSVNRELADRSCGVYTLKPGDAILWKFGEYR